MTLVLVLIWPYIFCYFADSTTERIANIQRSVYNLNWYDFPHNLRKHFVLIMAQSQRTACFDGLALVRCTLASFAIVITILIRSRLIQAFFCLIFDCISYFSFLLGLAASQIIGVLLHSFWCDIKPCIICWFVSFCEKWIYFNWCALNNWRCFYLNFFKKKTPMNYFVIKPGRLYLNSDFNAWET